MKKWIGITEFPLKYTMEHVRFLRKVIITKVGEKINHKWIKRLCNVVYMDTYISYLSQ